MNSAKLAWGYTLESMPSALVESDRVKHTHALGQRHSVIDPDNSPENAILKSNARKTNSKNNQGDFV